METKVLVLLDEKQETRRQRATCRCPAVCAGATRAPQRERMLIRDGRFARYIPQSKQVFRGQAKGEADLLVGFGPGAADLGQKYEVTLMGRRASAARRRTSSIWTPRGQAVRPLLGDPPVGGQGALHPGADAAHRADRRPHDDPLRAAWS